MSDGRIELVAENLTTTLHRLTSWAVERGIELEDLQVVRPTLEDIYLELTGVPPDGSPGGTTTEIPEPRPRRHGLRSRGRSRSEG